MTKQPEWFAPKSHGYGSGLPIAWQGWVLLIGFLGLVMALTLLIGQNLPAFLGLTTTLSMLFVWAVRRTTRGGWRWRWGDGD